MSKSEFRWNKKRKHYSYIYKDIGEYRKNILITSKEDVRNNKGRIKYKNIRLYRHPNPKKHGVFYVIPRKYVDHTSSFEEKTYIWGWDFNDKRKIKRLKRKLK